MLESLLKRVLEGVFSMYLSGNVKGRVLSIESSKNGRVFLKVFDGKSLINVFLKNSKNTYKVDDVVDIPVSINVKGQAYIEAVE